MNPQLDHAYAACRAITRAAAKNFYYAFLVLPGYKRDALAAVYAFMRHADDICDDPQVPLEDRRAQLNNLLDLLHKALAGVPTDDAVLMALADTQRRFKIQPQLLENLVHGTAMDLQLPQNAAGGPYVLYRTFDELYRYCYYVASVVGLVCIRIFGYRDAEAEPLAEQCGVAFQLTNIIRDVAEDASMGRIYLPEEDLARFGRSGAEFSNGLQPASLRPVLEFEAGRAREFYKAADKLMPLIDEESRPALWVLVEIYRRLLEKIAARNYDVFRERVSLTVPEKLAVLGKGFWRRLTA